MTTTYLGQSVQDLTKIGTIDFIEHYPQYLPKKGVWELWTSQSSAYVNRPFSSTYVWLDKGALILVDNEQWAYDLCAAGYKVGLVGPAPVLDEASVVNVETEVEDSNFDTVDLTRLGNGPVNYSEFYCKPPSNGMFFRVPNGVYFWTYAVGECDLHKLYLYKGQVIVTDNPVWAKCLTAEGFTVKLKVVTLNPVH